VAVKVVDPHAEEVVGDERVPKEKVGRSRARLSVGLSGAFKAKRCETTEAENGPEFDNFMTLVINAGAATPAEVVIGVADTAGTKLRLASTVRLATPATCTALLEVTPVLIVTVQCAYASS
jgi:hypothetical protein